MPTKVDRIGLTRISSQTFDFDIFRRSDDKMRKKVLNLIHILAIEMVQANEHDDHADNDTCGNEIRLIWSTVSKNRPIERKPFRQLLCEWRDNGC
ncbi:hypothetical protein D1872_255490 [compost metagenome]